MAISEEERKKLIAEEHAKMRGMITEELEKQVKGISDTIEKNHTDLTKQTVDGLEAIKAESKASLEALSSKGDGKPLGVIDEETGDPACGYKYMSEIFLDQKTGAESGVKPERLKKYEKMVVEKRAEMRAAGTGFEANDSQYGGYTLLPETFRAKVWERVLEIADVVSEIFVMPVSTTSLRIPAMGGYDRSGGLLYGGVRFYTEGENDSTTATRPAFEQIDFDMQLHMAETNISDKMMRFSPVTLDAFVQKIFSEALAFRLTNMIFNGNGNSEFQGVYGAGCTLSQAIESGQDADSVWFENITKMKSRIWRGSEARWYYNADCLPQLESMTLAVGAGGSVMPMDQVMRYPHTETEHCRAIGDVGDISLNNFSQYGAIVPAAQGMKPTFDSSIHFRFDVAQTTLRFMFYADGKPLWRTYETPLYGATTRSPFVNLAAR